MIELLKLIGYCLIVIYSLSALYGAICFARDLHKFKQLFDVSYNRKELIKHIISDDVNNNADNNGGDDDVG